MFLTFSERRSDSPFVDRIWRSRSDRAGVFLSVAACHFEIAVATGIPHRTVRQIERARHATTLLKDGASILDAVDRAGYFDQPQLGGTVPARDAFAGAAALPALAGRARNCVDGFHDSADLGHGHSVAVFGL